MVYKKRIIGLIFAIITGILIFHVMVSSFVLEIKYKSSDTGDIQIFFSDGSDYFNGEDSLSGKLFNTNNLYLPIEISIPFDKKSEIRIDIENIDKIELQSINFKILGMPISKSIGNEILKRFRANEQAKLFYSQNSVVYESMGADPNLLMNETLWDNSWIIYAIVFVVTLIVIVLVLLAIYLERKKNTLYLFYYIIALMWLIALFSTANPIFTFDSIWYFKYLDFFDGIKPITEWPIIRGFSFPTILWVNTILFKQNQLFGLMIIIGFFYLFSFILCNSIIKLNWNNTYPNLTTAFVFIIIMLNPIVFSWAHFVLTEYFVTTLLLALTLFAYKDYLQHVESKDFSNNQNIIKILVCSLLTIMIWFTKQMYITIPMAIIGIFQIFILYETKKNHIKNIIAFSLLLSICFLVSISSFSKIVESKPNEGFDATNIIVTGLRYFPINGGEFDFGSKSQLNYGDISKVEIKNDNYTTINEFNYTFENNLKSKIGFLMKCILTNPNRVIIGYIDNYLVISGLYSTPITEKINYSYSTVNKKFNHLIRIGETVTLATENSRMGIYNIQHAYNSGELFNVISTTNNIHYYSNVEKFNYIKSDNVFTKAITGRISRIVYNYLYMILIVLTIPMFLLFCALYIKSTDSKNKKWYALNCVLTGFSSMHILVLTFGGAIIDRYAFPSYIAMSIVFINLLIKLIDTKFKLYFN